jgi:hypothetical protein
MANYYTYGQMPTAFGEEDFWLNQISSPLASAVAEPPQPAAPGNIMNTAEAYKAYTQGRPIGPFAAISQGSTPGLAGQGLEAGTPEQTLSSLLKANKFSEAFQFAEQNNLQTLLTDPTKLKDLREPFTKEEAKQFVDQLPSNFIENAFKDRSGMSSDKFKELFEVDPKGAEERGLTAWAQPGEGGIYQAGETGYPSLDRVLKNKPSEKPGDFDVLKALAVGAAVFGVGSIFAGLAGAAGAGTAASAGAAGGAGGAGATGGLGAATGATATGFTPGLAGAQIAASGLTSGTTAAGLGSSIFPTVLITTPKAGLGSVVAPATVGTGAVASQLAGSTSAPSAATGQPTLEPPLDQVTVTTGAPIGAGEIVAPVLGGAAAESALTEAQQMREPNYQEGPVEEVVVEGTKPKLPLEEILTGVGAVELADLSNVIDVAKEVPEPQDVRTPLQKLQTFADKVGGWQNAFRILGGLGSLAGGQPKTPTATAPSASSQGFGGALPKYEFSRKQLQPDIDYYRYGLGPEARFFEDSMKQIEPAPAPAPATGIVNPEDEPVFAQGGLAQGGRYMKGAGSGRDDKIPALLSDGEYVIDAETLALLGDGSTKEGAKRMDEFRAKVRKHKGRALSRGQISPDAKSPSKYMGGGLT